MPSTASALYSVPQTPRQNAMHQALVISIVGPDHPGIVSKLAGVVAEHEANWLESHMANLAGQFAGIVQVEVPSESHDALVEALEAIGDNSLSITITDAASGDGKDAADGTSGSGGARRKTLSLELTGLDHPGIVRDIGRVLAELDVSVDELETERSSGSMSGEMLFVANARLALPDDVSIDAVDDALQTVSAGLMVDVVLEDDA